jgi:hypothetical protein
MVGLKKMTSRVPIKKVRPLLYAYYTPGDSISALRNKIGRREGSHRTFFAFGCKPARRQKTAFWQGSEKMASRLPIKKVRPLLYCKYPPVTLISTIFIEIGHREGSHRTFFAKLAAYRF